MGNCASQQEASVGLQRAGSAPAGLPSTGGVATGVLCFVEINPLVRQTSGVERGADDTRFMVKTDAWHSFSAAGFMVEAQLGLAGACTYDVLLAGPANVLAWVEAQAALEGGCQLSTSTGVLRLRWEVLQRLPGVRALALGAPAVPLTTTEAARVKAFAATATAAHSQQQVPEDLSRRARLLSSKGRKVFLPILIGEMLVATGQLQRSGDDLYSARKVSWMMPDLQFVGLGRPRASLPSLPVESTATPSQGTHTTLPSSSILSSSSFASQPNTSSTLAKAPSRQARREQQARAHQQQQHEQQLSSYPNNSHDHPAHGAHTHSYASSSSAPLPALSAGPPSAYHRPSSTATGAPSPTHSMTLHSGGITHLVAMPALPPPPTQATTAATANAAAALAAAYGNGGGGAVSSSGVNTAMMGMHHSSDALHAVTPGSSASHLPADLFSAHHLKHLSPPFDPAGTHGAGGPPAPTSASSSTAASSHATPNSLSASKAVAALPATAAAAVASAFAARSRTATGNGVGNGTPGATPGPMAEARRRSSGGGSSSSGGGAVGASPGRVSSWGLLGRVLALPGASPSATGAEGLPSSSPGGATSKAQQACSGASALAAAPGFASQAVSPGDESGAVGVERGAVVAGTGTGMATPSSQPVLLSLAASGGCAAAGAAQRQTGLMAGRHRQQVLQAI